MTDEEIKTHILEVIDDIFREVKTMTTGNLSHRQPSLLYDINALKNNVCVFINQNTKNFKNENK